MTSVNKIQTPLERKKFLPNGNTPKLFREHWYKKPENMTKICCLKIGGITRGIRTLFIGFVRNTKSN